MAAPAKTLNNVTERAPRIDGRADWAGNGGFAIIPDIMTKPFKRILLTGAGGNLGQRLREPLRAFADIVRLADMVDLGPPGPGGEQPGVHIDCLEIAAERLPDGHHAGKPTGVAQAADRPRECSRKSASVRHHICNVELRSSLS